MLLNHSQAISLSPSFFHWLAIGLLTVAASPIASSVQPLPPGGVPVIEEHELVPAKIVTRFGGVDVGNSEVQAYDHESFDELLHIQITQQPEHTWDIGASHPTTTPISKGDTLLFGFWARGKSTDGNGGGVAEFVFERNGEPYTKSVQFLIETPADESWKHYWVRFRSVENYAAGEAIVNFQLGYVESSIDLAGLELWNFGGNVELSTLPNSELTYVGRELDAPWRKAAAERIEKHRKGDLRLSVVDEDGQPMSGVAVQIELQRHAFDFGSAVSVDMLQDEGAQQDRYREMFLKHFNLAVIENGLKWSNWDGDPSKQQKTIGALQWLADHNIPSRGHVMVWPGHRYLPPWIKTIQQNADALGKVIDGHIREVGYAAGDRVRDWDVLNEVFDNRDLTNALGDEAMPHWFRVARSVAPNAKLYYNDYAGLVGGGFPTGHKAHFQNTVRYLIDHEAPIDGIGIQGHFGSILTSPRRLLAELDRYGEFGLDILITEFDVTVPGDQLRSDFTRDFLTTCFSHPNVDGILAWGFWAGAHWKPDAAFFDHDWNLTPAGKQWVTLTKQTWHTNETVTTNESGNASVRGFLGDYQATFNGKTQSFKLTDATTNVKLTW
ncbi:MAG: endo-1,4-beta-xylanase [Pirellulaceae bacterium]